MRQPTARWSAPSRTDPNGRRPTSVPTIPAQCISTHALAKRIGPAAISRNKSFIDPAARQERYEQLVAEYYEKGKALSTAAAFEIDDVIDPAQTRHVLTQTLARTRS